MDIIIIDYMSACGVSNRNAQLAHLELWACNRWPTTGATRSQLYVSVVSWKTKQFYVSIRRERRRGWRKIMTA